MFGKIFSGINSLIGSPLGAVGLDLFSQNNSAKEAQKDRHFQQTMSDTAHQREVADLKAAGLNPILSAGGKGASSPGGSTASISSLANAAGTGAHSAMALANAKSAKVTANLRSDMYNFYKKNPAVKAATNAAMLSKEAGIPPILPASGNAIKSMFGNSAKKVRNWFKGKGITKGPTSLAPSVKRHDDLPPVSEMIREKEFWDKYWEDSRNRGYRMERN